MTLWIAICPYDTHFFKLWSRLRLPIQCVIPYVIDLQAPSLVWYTRLSAILPQKQVNHMQVVTFKPNHLNNNYICLTNTCPIPLICRPIKSNPVLSRLFIYLFLYVANYRNNIFLPFFFSEVESSLLLLLITTLRSEHASESMCTWREW